MDRNDLKAGLVKVLAIAETVARFTPSKADDLAVGLLKAIVADDNLDRVLDLLGLLPTK